MNRRKLIAAGATALLAASSGAAFATSPAKKEGCKGLVSASWEAWLAHTPFSKDRLMLHIYGALQMATPGYTVELRAGPMTRSMPPSQILTLEIGEPKSKIVNQVVVPATVSLILPGEERYKSVIIGCGGETLHEFKDVPILR